MRLPMRSLPLLPWLCLLGACGQTGPLTLPNGSDQSPIILRGPEPPVTPVPTATPATPAPTATPATPVPPTRTE